MNRLDFHVHDDIDFMRKESGLPISFFDFVEVYIMQEDRIVHIGLKTTAIDYLIRNEGKRMKGIGYCFNFKGKAK